MPKVTCQATIAGDQSAALHGELEQPSISATGVLPDPT